MFGDNKPIAGSSEPTRRTAFMEWLEPESLHGSGRGALCDFATYIESRGYMILGAPLVLSVLQATRRCNNTRTYHVARRPEFIGSTSAWVWVRRDLNPWPRGC